MRLTGNRPKPSISVTIEEKFQAKLAATLACGLDNAGPAFLDMTDQEIADDLIMLDVDFGHMIPEDILPGIEAWRKNQ